MSLTKDDVSDLKSLIDRVESSAISVQIVQDAQADAKHQLANWLLKHTERDAPVKVQS